MNTIIPFVGKMYEVISGPFKGFVGKCVSYDLESDLPIILTDKNWYSHAVKLAEIDPIITDNINISHLQKN